MNTKLRRIVPDVKRIALERTEIQWIGKSLIEHDIKCVHKKLNAGIRKQTSELNSEQIEKNSSLKNTGAVN